MSNFQDIIKLASIRIPDPFLKPKPVYSTANPTTKAKYRETAIKSRKAKLIALSERLVILNSTKRNHHTFDQEKGQIQSQYNPSINPLDIPTISQPLINDGIPSNILEEIKKVKRQIWQVKTYLTRYTTTRLKYKSGIFITDAKKTENFIFMAGLFSAGWDSQKRWFESSQKHTTSKQKRQLQRLNWFTNEIQTPVNRIYLSEKDSKWLITKLRRTAHKLEEQRAINYTLPKEMNILWQNDKYREEIHTWNNRRGAGALSQKASEMETGQHGVHNHKYTPYDLEEITSPRPLQRLMDWYGCQLREDERNYLIELTNRQIKILEEIYTEIL